MNRSELPCYSGRSILEKFSTGQLMSVFALLYFAGAELGHILSFTGNFATLWPPGGIYLAALLVSSRKQWPFLIVMAFVANIASDCGLHDKQLWVSFCFCIANTIEATVSATLISYFTGSRFAVQRLRDVIIFLGSVTLVGSVLGAVVGSTILKLAFGAPLVNSFFGWWISGVLGTMLITPAITNWVVHQPWRDPGMVRRLGEIIFLSTFTGLLALYIFGYQTRPFVYLLLPLIVWASFRQRICGAVITTGVLSLVTIWQTTSGFGPFAMDRPVLEQLLLTQCYLSVCIALSLTIAAVTMHWQSLKVEIEVMNTELQRLSTTDPLTGISNRRAFQAQLEMELSRSRRKAQETSLILIDVDHFKSFNDNFGHSAGDNALKQVASILLEASRNIDAVARFGGEEFAIILPDTGLEDAMIAAKRVRLEIENAQWDLRKITVSLGIAAFVQPPGVVPVLGS